MKVKLNFRDRITINGLIPKKGDMITLVLSQSITDKVILNKKEIEKYNIKYIEPKTALNGKVISGGRYVWDKEYDKEITFKKRELQLIRKQIDTLDKKKELTIGLLDVCEKVYPELKSRIDRELKEDE